jgi:hypothetical protein
MGGNYERAWKCPVVVAGDRNFRHRRTAVYTAFLALQGACSTTEKVSKEESFARIRFELSFLKTDDPLALADATLSNLFAIVLLQ